MAEAIPKSDRVALARDLSEFLVELSIALHKHAMYPPGHPSLGPAAARLAERADRLLEGRPTIAFGVARYQLIIDGVATDPNQPVLRRLAEDLHRHHLGAISILPGVDADEIASALHTLAEESDTEKGPLGLARPGQVPDWPHLRLHPLTFDRLEIISDDPSSSPGDGGNAAGRAAHLWVGLASAAMASDATQKGQAATAEPAVVAKAIDEHRGTAAYDQVIVGYLLQIAEELRSASGADLGALRRRTARLIAALRPETLQRLLAMGGNVAQRRTFVVGATSGMAVDSVIKIIQAAADASGQVISDGLVRMLSKLATHAEFGAEQVRPLADGALREQIDRLLAGWQLDDPNPAAYGKVLQHLATTSSVGANPKWSKRLEHQDDALRIVKMGLEVAGSGPLVERAIDRVLDTDIRAVLGLLSSVPSGSGATAEAVKSKLLDSRTIARLVAREPLDTESLDELLPLMSIDAYEVLLDALAASENRTTRRKLLDRIAQTHLDISPLVVARLDDKRWYVQRNMLLLLERLQRIPPGFSAAAWTQHPDDRVRHQAIHLQLMIPEEKELAVAAALEDADGRTVRLGLLALQEECAPWFAPRVAIVAANPHAPEELRVHAVRALGRSREPAALDTLLRVVDGGRSVLGKPKLAARTPVVVAALRALAVGWRSDSRARGMLSLALGSPRPGAPAGGAGPPSMSDPAAFLNSFAQALAVMTLYPDGHPSRERAIDGAYLALDGLPAADGHPSFTFLDNEVVYGRERLRDFREWDWGSRLVAAGIQRLEFERKVTREEFEAFLQEVLARLMLSVIDTSESRQMRPLGIRFGAVGLQGQTVQEAAPRVATLDLTLGEEVETLRWMQQEVQSHGAIPLLEAETVVRSLSVAMHADRRIVLPLLQLKEFDQYTTTHSLNVAVLAMGLAENLGCTPNEVRGYGVAGLLHDIGKIRIPLEVLTKPGKLTEEERSIINRHPADGARTIMQSDEELDLAAIVAYEHHIMLNGGGYPTVHYSRPCILASRLVHVCDVFDALRTKRPYRNAWESEKVFAYLLERAGTEFDPDLVSAFVRMLREGEAHVNIVTEEQVLTAPVQSP